METNETIITKQVVSLGDASQVGSVSGVIIDPATRGVSHYLIKMASGNTMALPFDKALSVGDTFLIMEDEQDLVPEDGAQAPEERLELVGLDVYSGAGDKLGTVVGYEIDTIYGDVVKVFVDDDGEFNSDEFIFFSPSFIFVNDGSKTDAELRGVAARATRGSRGVVNPLG